MSSLNETVLKCAAHAREHGFEVSLFFLLNIPKYFVGNRKNINNCKLCISSNINSLRRRILTIEAVSTLI